MSHLKEGRRMKKKRLLISLTVAVLFFLLDRLSGPSQTR
jgi:hypothetical protein